MADVAKREAVIAAALAALTAGVPDVPVERNRRADVDADEAPRLVVFDGDHTTDYVDLGDASYTMQMAVDGTVTVAADSELGPAVNVLYARALAALTTDPTLGGAVEQVREAGLSVRIVPTEQSAKPLAIFTLDLTIEFRTGDGNPFA